ncbi:MAG: alkane 1-monooxygenase [Candidatus Sericytochromatia bacterium]
MRLKSLKYLLVYTTPIVVLLSIFSKNNWSYSAFVFLFGIIPFIELFTKESTKNFDSLEEEIAKKDKIYDFILYGLVPIQYFILICFLFYISNESLSLTYKIGATISFGLSCGILGINAAHELGHRSTWYEQLMGKMLLLTTLYMHFYIEHNRGHHANVSTEKDPASSRYGENVYSFFIRSIYCSWMSAWHLESKKLKSKNLPFLSFKNEMLVYQFVQLFLVAIIGYIFGLESLLFFICGAFIGILLLEAVNYIEHYGLKRKKIGDRYERTMPIHSWNSNHPLGRIILLELSRHSDHHYIASRKYQLLRHFDESPQMPTGYPGMIILSLFPPLWFRTMHKKIEVYKTTEKGAELA